MTTTAAPAPAAVNWTAHPGGRSTGSTFIGHKATVQQVRGRRHAWLASAPSGRRIGMGFEDSVGAAKSAAEDAIAGASS